MYDDKYVRRGEIYTIKSGEYDDPTGSMTRPGLIISNNKHNSSRRNTVIVAMLTTSDHNVGFRYGPINNTGRESYVCCENIATVTKSRLGRLMGSLSENQMKEVESRLDEVLDLGYVDDTPLKEKEQEINALKLQLEELKSEVFRLKTSLDATRDEVLTRDVEIAVHKRMYEKAVGVIAAMRAEPDMPENPRFLNKKIVEPPKPVEEPKEPEPPKNPEPPKKPKLTDINTATFSQLRGIGLSNGIVLAVINGRPYKKVEDLKKIPGVTGKLYGIIEKKICCVPVESPKVEEPVEEPKPVIEEPEVTVQPTKVNVNTATAQEIHDITGLHITACYAITGKRKQVGRFINLEELVIPGRLSAKLLEKYRDKMEV